MRVLGSLFACGFKASIQYRWTFFITFVLQLIILVINMVIFKTIYAYNQTTQIKGYDFEQMVWYFVAASFVLSFAWNNTEEDISDDVTSGNLSTILLRPVSYCKYLFGLLLSSRVISIIMDLVPGIVIYSLILPPTFLSAAGMLKFALVAILSLFLNYIMSSLIGLFAFFLKKSMSITGIKEAFFYFAGGLFIPLELFPEQVNRVLSYLPFKYIYYWPIQFFLNRTGTEGFHLFAIIVGIQAIWIAVFYGVYRVLWKRAAKHYCAVGG